MAQSDQVAPGPGPKLTCSTPKGRPRGRALTPGWPSTLRFCLLAKGAFISPEVPSCNFKLSTFNQCSAFVPPPEYG
jgi:hypothetical protein